MTKYIRIILADDHPIFRQGLISIIEKHRNLSIVGEAENGVAALALIEKEQPDLAILDVDMPEMDGIEVARLLGSKSDETKAIFMTMHKDALILRSLKTLGVRGYVLKDSALEDIIECINAVASGRTFLSPALSDLLFDAPEETEISGTLNAITLLTKTEKQILQLISESMTNREIAESLFVTVRTVETHRHNICAKIGITGTNALLKFAIRHKESIRKLMGK